MDVSVIISTHNPNPERFRRTLLGLRAQTLRGGSWETVIVDNASAQFPDAAFLDGCAPTRHRVVTEPALGLTAARLCGIRAALGDLLVFVDDDNVLAPDYLAVAVRLFEEHPGLGAAGGPIVAEWETPPPGWVLEFQGLLALRDLGPAPRVCEGGAAAPWPDFAPVGAGLVVRRTDALGYAEAVARDPLRRALDRAGHDLNSGGDNDLVFTVLQGGGNVAYFPTLRLTHLIPAARLEPGYLARLNAGIMHTWVVVLHIHGQCPWRAVQPWTVPFRCGRSWWQTRAWRSPPHRIRWRGRCGQFRGQAMLHRLKHVI